ncbi:MAG: cell division protein FtsQ/DivIB [Bacillota bacterium]
MNEKRIITYVIIIIFIIGIISFIHSPLFRVNKIEIYNLKILNKSDIMDKLGSYYNKNLFLIDTENIKNDISHIDYIKDLNINKTLPNQIEINVEERTPLAKIDNEGQYLVLNKDGFILEESSSSLKADVPLIQGMGYSFENEQRLSLSTVLDETLIALKNVSSTSLGEIKKIEYKDEKLEAKISRSVPVYLGETTKLNDKFKLLSAVINKVEEENLNIEYINIEKPEKPVIKPK